MKIIIFGWYGAGNLGDEAILQAMLSFLKSQKGVELDIVSFNPAKTARLTEDFTIVKNIIRIGSKFNFLRSDFKGIWKSLKTSHAVIIGGGGLFQDIYNFYFIPFFTLVVAIAVYLKKRVFFYSLGIGPFKRNIARWLCKKAANRVEYISVRDPLSQERLKELNIRQAVHLAPDPVFLLKAAESDKAYSFLTAEGYNIEGSLKIGLCLQRLFRWGKQVENTMAETLDYWVQERKAEILFIPFGRYPNSWLRPNPADVDVAASERIASLMKQKSYILQKEYNPDEIMAIIGKMDVIISMRFHGLIMSLVMGIPSLALTYRVESKLSNLFKQLGLSRNLFYIEELDKHKLMKRMDYILENYPKLRKVLQPFFLSLQQQAAQGMQSLMNQLFMEQSKGD